MSPELMTAVTPVSSASLNHIGEGGAEYRIGVGDTLTVRVFQVPDLSFDALVVDSSGSFQMPLIGAIQAVGLTSAELSQEIASRLQTRYLRDPQVTVTVAEAASQKFTVDGAVTRPGVYEMTGSTTLLQAVAMAQGPSRSANLKKVAVFRTIEGQRAVALFDLQAIRQGQAEDPPILGEDVIVVDTSRLSQALQAFISTVPALAVFRLL